MLARNGRPQIMTVAFPIQNGDMCRMRAASPWMKTAIPGPGSVIGPSVSECPSQMAWASLVLKGAMGPSLRRDRTHSRPKRRRLETEGFLVMLSDPRA